MPLRRCKPPGAELRRVRHGGGRPLDPGGGGLDALAASSYLQRRWASILHAVVLYTALWCPHSRRMRPAFERVALNESAALTFGVIDCAGEDAPACGDACPLGFPSVRFLRQGVEVAEYTGEPDDGALLGWIRRQAAAARRVAGLDQTPPASLLALALARRGTANATSGAALRQAALDLWAT